MASVLHGEVNEEFADNFEEGNGENDKNSIESTGKITKKRLKPPIIFRCEICLEEFENENILKEHLDEHDFIYSCETCSEKFKIAMDFTDHVWQHNTENSYKCALCDFTAEKRNKIVLHLQNNHEEFKKYRCKICKKGINVYTHFLEHKFVHTGEKPFKCNKCESSFSQNALLQSHYTRMHVFESIDCDVCQKTCRNKMELRSHKSHHKKQPAACENCGKLLSSREKLRIHRRIHTGERPYACKFCEKTFKTSTFRADHEKIHTGEKPHICSICRKGFSQRTSMKIHETTHSTERPFQCDICGKKYKSKIILNGHVKKCREKQVNKILLQESVSPEQLSSNGLQNFNQINFTPSLNWNQSFVQNYDSFMCNPPSTSTQVDYSNTYTNYESTSEVTTLLAELGVYDAEPETSQNDNSEQTHSTQYLQGDNPASHQQHASTSTDYYRTYLLHMEYFNQDSASGIGNSKN